MSGHAPPCPHSCCNHSLPPPPLLALGCCLPCSTPPGSLPLRSRNRSLILPRLLALSVFHLSRCWACFVRFKSSRHRPTPFITVRTFKADWIATRATGLPPGICDCLHQCEQDMWILQLLITAGGDILGILVLGLLEDNFDNFEQFLKV